MKNINVLYYLSNQTSQKRLWIIKIISNY